MVFNPNIPIGQNSGAEQQDDLLTNFTLANTYFGYDHIPFSGLITNITQANPGVVSSPLHNLSTGNTVTFQGLSDNLNDDPALPPNTGMGALNGLTKTITVIDKNSFSLNATNTTSFETYVSGGNYAHNNVIIPGYHKKITLPGELATDPITPTSSNISMAVYPKDPLNNDILQLFWQNGIGSSFVQMLTELTPNKETSFGTSFKTPWGLILNMGQVKFLRFGNTITFPTEFSSTVYSIIAFPFGTFSARNLIVDTVSLTSFSAIGVIPGQGYYLAIGK